MSKTAEDNYKIYLQNSFNKLLNYSDSENSDNWYIELLTYNKIIGSLIGLIEAKEKYKNFQNCKNFVQRYYEQTYPKKQLREVDEALYSKNCYEYLNYSLKKLVIDKRDLEILKEFIISYSLGKDISKYVSLKSILPYFAKNMNIYINKLKEKENKELH